VNSLYLISLTVITTIVGFSNLSFDKKNNHNAASVSIDSCEIAIKFENAKLAESMVPENYSGELNNYWGNDVSKLDYKYVFREGRLVKSYFYYENQIIQEEYSFKCGALHGLQIWNYENGKLAQSIPFSYGYKHGEAKVFYEEGNLKQRVTFKNDTIVGKVEQFDKSGKIIENDTIQK
jgi:antitoxin component YwqK of YwqJK toxin-antitoxin module